MADPHQMLRASEEELKIGEFSIVAVREGWITGSHGVGAAIPVFPFWSAWDDA